MTRCGCDASSASVTARLARSGRKVSETSVDATRSGETFRVEASAEFEGSLTRAWQVLTDYGRFAEFVPDLQVSRVLCREHNSVLVEQKGAARLLFWSYPMDVRLAVTEHPYERVESRSVSGNAASARS